MENGVDFDLYILFFEIFLPFLIITFFIFKKLLLKIKYKKIKFNIYFIYIAFMLIFSLLCYLFTLNKITINLYLSLSQYAALFLTISFIIVLIYLFTANSEKNIVYDKKEIK